MEDSCPGPPLPPLGGRVPPIICCECCGNGLVLVIPR